MQLKHAVDKMSNLTKKDAFINTLPQPWIKIKIIHARRSSRCIPPFGEEVVLTRELGMQPIVVFMIAELHSTDGG